MLMLKKLFEFYFCKSNFDWVLSVKTFFTLNLQLLQYSWMND
uniref:Uncharacterized protein n=1 Tax=Anguilla anguilla TaxID=7936 RepID=A0A0E9XNA2_ANGAN